TKADCASRSCSRASRSRSRWMDMEVVGGRQWAVGRKKGTSGVWRDEQRGPAHCPPRTAHSPKPSRDVILGLPLLRVGEEVGREARFDQLALEEEGGLVADAGRLLH